MCTRVALLRRCGQGLGLGLGLGFGRNLAISREVRVHGDEEGSGSISPATPSQSAIAVIEAKIEAVEKEIEAVEKKIEAVETALSGGLAYLGVTDGNFLLKQLERLQQKEKQLREEKGQLREEKKELRQLPAQASLLTPGTISERKWTAAL
ncbi:unnamed protein product [Ectocarpus fasciculatus]